MAGIESEKLYRREKKESREQGYKYLIYSDTREGCKEILESN